MTATTQNTEYQPESAFCDHDAAGYRLAINEGGWHCTECGKELGFRPDLDRADTELKVSAILHTMHDAGLLYVSNGTMGDIVISNVAHQCRYRDLYDQQSIMRFIMDDPNMWGHDHFWREEARRWQRSRPHKVASSKKDV